MVLSTQMCAGVGAEVGAIVGAEVGVVVGYLNEEEDTTKLGSVF